MNTENNDFPQELKGFNFGAFFLSWIWGLAHKVWIALLPLVFQTVAILGSLFGVYLIYSGVQRGKLSVGQGAFVAVLSTVASLLSLGGFAFSIYLGLKGNRLAWQKGGYASIDEFKKREKKWTIAGIIYLVFNLVIVSPILCVSFIILSSKAVEKIADPMMASANKKTAKNLEQVLEEQFDVKNQRYCGGILIACGKYSFKKASDKLERVGGIVPLAGTCSGSEQFCGKCNDPFSGVEGGGYIEIKADGYTIIPYDAKCTIPLQEAEIIKKNKGDKK